MLSSPGTLCFPFRAAFLLVDYLLFVKHWLLGFSEWYFTVCYIDCLFPLALSDKIKVHPSWVRVQC